MIDDLASTEGLLFKRMLADVAVPRTDPDADNILMINSFNEWHEDTQIEPTIVAPRTDADDSSSQSYTKGYFYQGYGDLYLNILRDATHDVPEPASSSILLVGVFAVPCKRFARGSKLAHNPSSLRRAPVNTS
jgi:hypothetical protein